MWVVGGCRGGVVGMEEEAVGVVLSDGGNTTNSRAVRACVLGYAIPNERADRGFSLFSQPDFSQFSACFSSHVL